MKDKIKSLFIYIIYTLVMGLNIFSCLIGSLLLYEMFYILGVVFIFGFAIWRFKNIDISKFIKVKNFFNRFAPLFLSMLLFLFFLSELLISYNLPVKNLPISNYPYHLYAAIIAQIGILIGFILNKNNKKESMNFRISLIPFIYLAVAMFFIINIKVLDNENNYYLLDDSWLERENAYSYITQESPYSVEDIRNIKTDTKLEEEFRSCFKIVEG